MAENIGTLDYVTPNATANRESSARELAGSSASAVVSDPIVRDTLPDEDFDSSAETTWTGDTSFFVQTPNSDVQPGGETVVYEIDSDTGRGDERVTVVYGFEAISGAELVGSVEFLSSDEQTFERAQIQGLDSGGDVPTDRQKLLAQPVRFDLQDSGTVQFVYPEGYSTADDPPVAIKLLAVTAEKRNRVVGPR
jgi:hypothetical protein